MRFRVLTHRGTDAEEWSALIARLRPELRDIHFLPEYGAIYNRTYGYEPFLACLEQDDDFVIQPFVKRNLNELPFLREQHVTEPYYDISNPYGYGGPLCCSESEEEGGKLFRKFNGFFKEYCVGQHFASEFVSLHPLLGNHDIVCQSGEIEVVHQKDIVYMDLNLEEAELWKGIRKGHKSSIKKAIKGNIRVEKVAPVLDNFAIFNRLYYETMERNCAAQRWLFPDDYFMNCHELLGGERISLFFAYYDDEVAAVSIVMHDFDTVYYHFSGSDNRFFNLCPNNLMVYEIALWAKGKGYHTFHLGGGVTSSTEDSLFIFKSGFSDRRGELHTYSRILDEQTYHHLCTLKKNQEIKAAGAENTSDYFPLYRR